MKTCSYTEELGARICEAIARSEKGLAHICAENDFPAPSTIYDWLNKKKEFRRQYVFAKEMQTETICTKILLSLTAHASGRKRSPKHAAIRPSPR